MVLELNPVGIDRVRPAVRKLSIADLRVALERGLDDFSAAPTHGIFLALLYPVIGLLLGSAALDRSLTPMVFPLAAGFALVAPIAATGSYVISRLREQNRQVTFEAVASGIREAVTPGFVQLLIMLGVLFAAWLFAASQIYAAVFGDARPASLPDLIRDVVSTSTGIRLLVIGNLVGLVFAAIAFVASAVSFPMVIDRKVSAAEAIVTSAQVVAANPVVMAAWAALIAGAIVVGSIPLLMGLAVVLPVFGHATWHLYRRSVV
jgi:uncharacterized membrane protein